MLSHIYFNDFLKPKYEPYRLERKIAGAKKQMTELVHLEGLVIQGAEFALHFKARPLLRGGIYCTCKDGRIFLQFLWSGVFGTGEHLHKHTRHMTTQYSVITINESFSWCFNPVTNSTIIISTKFLQLK